VLKKIGLKIDAKTYYNLWAYDSTRTLNLYNKLVLLLKELKDRYVYVAIKKKYVLDKEGNKRDCVILCIAWWTSEQIWITCRFVFDILAKTDVTFNTNEKRLLL
jgi:hypothetical protein